MVLRVLLLLVGSLITIGLLSQVVDAGVGTTSGELKKPDKKEPKKDKGGKDKAGKDKKGGKDKAGKDKAGKDKAGRDKGGKDKAGKDKRGGKDKAGKDKRGGKDKAGRDKLGRREKDKGKTKPRPEKVVLNHARFGLPNGHAKLLPYGTKRLFKTDRFGKPLRRQPAGYPKIIANDYKPQRGEVVQPQQGLVFNNPPGGSPPAPVDFKAGVYGKVVPSTGGTGGITIQLADGSRVQYLDYSMPAVKVGDTITPTTVLGKTGTKDVSLSINALDKTGASIDPEEAITAGSEEPEEE